MKTIAAFFGLVTLPMALTLCVSAVLVMALSYGAIWLAQIVTDFLGEHCEDFE